jgi:hypothetical protein
MTMTLTDLADALLMAPEPMILLLDADGFAMTRPLGGASPADVLDALGPDEGRGWHAVALLVHGKAINLDTGEHLGTMTIAMAMSRHEAAARCLGPDGIITEPPSEGRIPDAIRAFLG